MKFAAPSVRLEDGKVWLFRCSLLVLGFVIYGPWLRPGTLFGLDWATGPHLTLPPAIYGFGQGRAVTAPSVAVITLCHSILGVDITAVALFLSPLIMGFGMEKVLGKVPLAWLAAALFASLNPFVDERLGSGSFGVVFSLLCYPFVVKLAEDSACGNPISCVKLAVVICIGTALSPQFIFLGSFLAIAVIISARFGKNHSISVNRPLTGWLIGILTLIFLSAYWLFPLLLVGFPSYYRIGLADLNVFASRSDPVLGLYPNLLGLYGFWRPVAPLAKSVMTGWWLFLVALISMVLFGFATFLKLNRRLAWVLAFVGVAGLIASAGTQGPFGHVFLYFFKYVPGAKAFREPEKALALLVIAYAIFFGAGVHSLVSKVTSERLKILLAAFLFLIPFLYGITQVWGLWNSAKPIQYPVSWSQAQVITSKARGTILVLPWHEFQSYPFSGGRVIANPAPAFFSDPTLTSSNAEIPQLGNTSSDPREVWINRILSAGNRNKRVGQKLAPLGVRWIFLSRTTNWQQYSWLFNQPELKVYRNWHGAVLFQNTAWLGEVYATSPSGVRKQLIGWSPNPTYVAINKIVVPGSMITFTQPYSKGWKLGGLSPSRNFAGTNAFGPIVGSASKVVGVSFVIWQKVRIAVALSILTLVLSLVLVAVDRRRRRPGGLDSL